MAGVVVPATPYDSIQALAAWMVHREPFMRGFALRHGLDWEQLEFREQIDLAEQALFEPALHGSWTSVDEALDKMSKALIEANPTEETFGTDPISQRAQARAEEMFGAASPRRPRVAPVTPEPSTIPPDEPPAE